ncbi:hypothetical protein [Rhizobium sp. 11_C7_N12_5]|uniref:hypothetical protein n=1 Tax=Rhizobium sp. 11_C7_N12_5 TaxID=3240770 RepID=UPI003F226DCC
MADKLDAGSLPTTILHHLSDGACQTIDALNEQLGLDRRQISDGAARLVLRGYLERIETGCYQLTDAGRVAAERGEVIKAGPWRPDTAKVRKPVRNTFRQRVWSAMRMGGTFTLADVVMAAATAEDDNPKDNASRFVRHLKACGYIAELPVRQAGTRLTSTGFKRYRLLRDTGPIAPQYRPKSGVIHDFNTGEDIACAIQP